MEAFFAETAEGRRFCLYHPPAGEARGAVLYLHPFAEELNRTRRMAALQARRLAGQGYAVLQWDLLGCGDSEGDFGDATWALWEGDVDAAIAWLRARCAAPLWLWGMRAGCLLAAGAARRHSGLAGLLLWQPLLSGRQALRQFLRIKLAEQMRDEGQGEGAAALRARLEAGGKVEVAGYMLSPGLAAGLEAADMALPGSLRIECVETGPSGAPAPALAAQLAKWNDTGHRAHAVAVSGAQFWQMAEPEDVPAMLAATEAALAGERQAAGA
jgi:exosortase A-associated hydrolase 2